MTHIEKLLSRIETLDRGDLERHIKEWAPRLMRMESALEALPDGLFISDEHGRIGFMNRAARNMLAIPDTASKKWTVQNLFQDKALKAAVREAVLDGKPVLNREVEILVPRALMLDVSVYSFTDELGKVGKIIVLVDAAYRRGSERTLRKNEKAQSILALAQAVAHEIGNPLNSIGIHLKLLQKSLEASGDQKKEKSLKTLGVLVEETARLDRIIRQFLAFTRRPALQLRKHNVNTIVRDAINFLIPEMQESKVTYTLELSRDVPAFLLDGELLYRAFLNLAKNAIQAMPKGGHLRVRTERVNKLVTVSFKDDGPGISPTERDRIFDLYFTTKPTGSGLGLPIAEQIVGDHGGRIEVESAVGKGATFTVILPIRENRPELPHMTNA